MPTSTSTSNTTPRLLCAAPLPPRVAERAAAEFDAILSQDGQMTPQQVLAAVQADERIAAILVSSRVKMAAADIAALPARVRLIATCSVGYEHVDVAAAQAHGVAVSNTPEVLTDATADLALLLMLGACRRAREYLQIMDRGWRERYGLGDMLGQDFSGKALGIVGMGRIGQAVAQRARGFGVSIHYHNRRRLDAAQEQGATYHATLAEMLPHCQILSLHFPAGAGTQNLIDAQALARMPRGSVLVNTARGGLVNEDDLIAALQSGQLAAAGLDVFQGEPEYDLRLKDLPNVFMTPHMGSATAETRDAMGHRSLDNVAAVFAGRPPGDGVTA